MPGVWNEAKQRWEGEPYTDAVVAAHRKEINDLLSQGMTRKQVAEQLHITVATVGNRLRRAEERLGAPMSLAQLVELAEATPAPAPTPVKPVSPYDREWRHEVRRSGFQGKAVEMGRIYAARGLPIHEAVETLKFSNDLWEYFASTPSTIIEAAL